MSIRRPRFIEIVTQTDERVCLNLDSIVSATASDTFENHTWIFTTNGSFLAKQPYVEIAALLKDSEIHSELYSPKGPR